MRPAIPEELDEVTQSEYAEQQSTERSMLAGLDDASDLIASCATTPEADEGQRPRLRLVGSSPPHWRRHPSSPHFRKSRSNILVMGTAPNRHTSRRHTTLRSAMEFAEQRAGALATLALALSRSPDQPA